MQYCYVDRERLEELRQFLAQFEGLGEGVITFAENGFLVFVPDCEDVLTFYWGYYYVYDEVNDCFIVCTEEDFLEEFGEVDGILTLMEKGNVVLKDIVKTPMVAIRWEGHNVGAVTEMLRATDVIREGLVAYVAVEVKSRDFECTIGDTSFQAKIGDYIAVMFGQVLVVAEKDMEGKCFLGLENVF